jgi:hypothetical protein
VHGEVVEPINTDVHGKKKNKKEKSNGIGRH